MTIQIFAVFIAGGCLSGLLAGLLGIGGGVVTVPIFYFVFKYLELPHTMQAAVSTSLAATILTSLSSTLAHQKRKGIQTHYLRYAMPCLFLGCLAGALTGHLLPSAYLRELFGIMAILLGIYFFFPKLPRGKLGTSPNFLYISLCLMIGYLSTLFGIGGGIFMVPVLLGYHLDTKHAVATSAATTLVTALAGTFTYLFLSAKTQGISESVGYIEIPAFLASGIASCFCAPFGAKMAHTLPTHLIRKVFAFALASTGISMLLTN